MLLPDLMRLIESHADVLARELLRDIKTNPKTRYLHRVPDRELWERAFDLYSGLARWLSARQDAEIEQSYRELGRTRAIENVPMSELVFALLLVKNHLRDFIRRNDVVQNSVEMYQEDQLFDMIDKFFDKAVYHAVRGHETAAREPRTTLQTTIL